MKGEEEIRPTKAISINTDTGEAGHMNHRIEEAEEAGHCGLGVGVL